MCLLVCVFVSVCVGVCVSECESVCVFVFLQLFSGMHKHFLLIRVLSSPANCLTPPNFSTLFHKGQGFSKHTLSTKCVFWFSVQILSEIFLVLRRIGRDITINVYCCSCKVPVILVRFLIKLVIS